MQHDNPGPKFWLGNVVLVVALLILLNMGTLWEKFGVTAMMVWVAVAGFGAYLLLTGKEPPKGPQ